MKQRLIDKLIRLAEKNPKGVFRSTFFAKYCELLGINIEEKRDLINYSYNGKEISAVLITHENCKEYKCIISPEINGVRIWDFLRALVYLNTSQTIDSPTEPLTAGKEALYFIEESKKYLQQ